MKTILSIRNQAKAEVLGIQHAFAFSPFCSVDSDFEKQGADICKLIWKHACMVDSESVSPFYYYFFFLWQ